MKEKDTKIQDESENEAVNFGVGKEKERAENIENSSISNSSIVQENIKCKMENKLFVMEDDETNKNYKDSVEEELPNSESGNAANETGELESIDDPLNDSGYMVISECGVEEASQDTAEDTEDLGFIVDTQPVEEKKNSSDVPLFKRSRKNILKEEDKKPLDVDCAKLNRIKGICFNCDGDHSLRDCELPRDMKKINRARKLRNMKNERYHVDVEQRFAHIQPGKISEALARALGIRNNEIPSMFYKMRHLKYPPAWLEEAKIAHSGITLFGSKGCTVLGSDDDEGELAESKLKYDLSKIISFPGFNIDPGSGYFDDYEYQRAPPISSNDSKERYIKSFEFNAAKQGYKRKRLKMDIEQSDEFTLNVESNIADMEVDEDEVEKYNQNLNLPVFLKNQPPPPLDEPPSLPPPPPEERDLERSSKLLKENHEETTLVDDNFQELSLNALEMKQAELLKLLNTSDENLEINIDSKTNNPLWVADLSIEKHTEAEVDENEKLSDKSLNCQSNQLTENSIIENNDGNKINQEKNTEIVKSSVVGTPILKFSPYDKLPPGHLFKEGVSDVINFENLPDSTGKYDQMKKLLYVVRKRINEINQMPDD